MQRGPRRFPRRDFLRGLSAAGVASQLAGDRLLASPGGGDLPPRYPVATERVFLPMDDGVRIAATLYTPQGAAPGERFPAILQVLPYRKDDDYATQGHAAHAWFSAHGYLCCRVDVRGTGASFGVPGDEYSAREHADSVAIIDWLARHPLSNGRVGMWGASYGGFNSIQVAMLRPPALKAIVPIYATDDRYTDDVHYYGGCLHAFENIWAVGMEAENAFPPYPRYQLDDPRTQQRFHAEPWSFRWLRHQTDGPYWRPGSLRPDYGAIDAATLMIGGWMDGYCNSVPRMLAGMGAPSKAILGPWPHTDPSAEGPWPRIHDLHEILRWWDHWLKDADSGVQREPRLAVFVRESHRPTNFRLEGGHIPGWWRHEEGWPPEGVEPRTWFCDRGALRSTPGAARRERLVYRPTTGTTSKTWAPNGDGSYGLDQRGDDAFCLCFDTAPLSQPLELLGFARARLWAASPCDRMNWILRVNDVAPDGTSSFVTRGVLNATHRSSHTHPAPLVPGEPYPLDVEMQVSSWVFPAGHRIRLAISNGDWPVVWPSPFPGTNTVFTGGPRPSHLELPVRTPARHGPAPRFRAPEAIASEELYRGFGAPPSWVVHRDQGEGATTLGFQDECGTELLQEGLRLSSHRNVSLTARDPDPARARLGGWADMRITGRGKDVSLRAEVSLESDAEAFHLTVRRRLEESGRSRTEREWSETIPRNLV